MITSIKDDNDRIVAYTESWQVAKSGYPKYDGEYLWIHDIWVHEDYRNQNKIIEMVSLILNRLPNIKYGYWRRHKYNNRTSKLYHRDEFQKLIKRMESYHGWRRRTSTSTAASTA